MNQCSKSTKRRRIAHKGTKPQKQPKIESISEIPSGVCMNDILPIEDLLSDIMKYLSAFELLNLKNSCQLYRNLINLKDFRKFVKLEQTDVDVLSYHFGSSDSVPYIEMSVSLELKRCVNCKNSKIRIHF